MAEIDGSLKASHIIPPILALAAVLAWNLAESRSIRSLDAGTRELRGKIASARGSGVSAVAGGRKPKTPLKIGGAIDWKGMSQRIAAMQDGGGTSDIRAMMDFQQRLSGMTGDEIVAAFDEIQALGLEEDERSLLEEMLIEPLIEKDPELALARFVDRIGNDDDGVAWQLSAAMGNWAKKDLTAATAWFDRQIAAGVFDSRSLDGRSQARLEFEAALAAELLGSDSAEAGQRIAALPEDQRREALEQISFSELSPAAQAAYAGLVRSLVPQDERAGSFTHVISELVPDGGYTQVDAFLDTIRATAEERQVSSREAANTRIGEIAGEREVTRQDVDAMREWVEKQAPGTADKVTGEALADAAQEGGELDFEGASDLVLEYHQRSGSDDVLVSFLESFAARSNLELALPLAEKIRDPKRRAEILAMLH